MYSCQIKIAKVKIMIGNRTEPSSKISGLWIPRHKEHPIRKLMRLKIFFKECSLLANHPKVFHILNAHHNHVFRNGKPLPV